MASPSLTFKIAHGADLRRITVPKEPVLAFATLASKAGALFGLQTTKFSYSDADGDVITLACEDDLKELFLQQLPSPVRLTVVPGAQKRVATVLGAPLDVCALHLAAV